MTCQREIVAASIRTAGIIVFVAAIVTCDGKSAIGPNFGAPASILFAAGQDQTGTVGQELPVAVQIKVVDSRNRPVPQQAVRFRVTAGNGNVSPEAVSTSGDGVA